VLDSRDWWIRRAMGQETRIADLQRDLAAVRRRADNLVTQIREARDSGPEDASWILDDALAGLPPAESGEVRDRIRL
jgi:hypothetical protein